MVHLGFRTGASVVNRRTESSVQRVQGMALRTSREVHRFLGLVRFRRMADGTYYAPIEPDTDILNLMAPHFQARFQDQNWILHDTKRGHALHYSAENPAGPSRLQRVHGFQIESGAVHHEEAFYSGIWREYYRSISIEERKNHALRQNFMPKKYWKNLTEMEESFQ